MLFPLYLKTLMSTNQGVLLGWVFVCFKPHLFISLEKQNTDVTDIKDAYKSPHHLLKIYMPFI